jgi:hypothetical protein
VIIPHLRIAIPQFLAREPKYRETPQNHNLPIVRDLKTTQKVTLESKVTQALCPIPSLRTVLMVTSSGKTARHVFGYALIVAASITSKAGLPKKN